MSQVQYQGENLEKHFYELENFDDSYSKIYFHNGLSQSLLRRLLLQQKLDENMKLILQT